MATAESLAALARDTVAVAPNSDNRCRVFRYAAILARLWPVVNRQDLAAASERIRYSWQQPLQGYAAGSVAATATPTVHSPQFQGAERQRAEKGQDATATRKPLMPLRGYGASLRRSAQRTYLRPRYHEPPRNTRNSPDSGPCGFSLADLP
jgi:hypothetical protein